MLLSGIQFDDWYSMPIGLLDSRLKRAGMTPHGASAAAVSHSLSS